MGPGHQRGLSFHGAKAALLCGEGLAVLRRDDRANIPWPGRIDLPGGGREAGETSAACAAREIREETGLALAARRFTWAKEYAWDSGRSWFLAVRIARAEAAAMRLGAEGQALWMIEIGDFLAARDAIPHQQDMLRDYLSTTV